MTNNMTTASCTLKEPDLLDGTLTQNIFIRLTPIIICVGLLGNILTICVFIITDLKRQSVSILTIALGIVDSLVLLIPVSLLWLESILKRELTDASSFWCRTHGKNFVRFFLFFEFICFFFFVYRFF